MIYLFFKNLYIYITHLNYLNKVYSNEQIISNLSKILKFNLKIDWVGRLYCVVNPWVINENNDSVSGFINQSDQSFFIRNWLIGKLNLSKQYIINNNLFELLGLDIKKIDDNQNYLLTIYPISLLSVKQSFKHMMIEVGIILLIILLYLLIPF